MGNGAGLAMGDSSWSFTGLVLVDDIANQVAGFAGTPRFGADSDSRPASQIVNPKHEVGRETVFLAEPFRTLDLRLPSRVVRGSQFGAGSVRKDERFLSGKPMVNAQQAKRQVTNIKHDIPQRRPWQRTDAAGHQKHDGTNGKMAFRFSVPFFADFADYA